MFAETGIKDLFKGILRLLSTYNTKPMVLRLRNKWVNVDPRAWKTSWDMTVSVGLGTGDKSAQIQMLQTVVGMQDMLLKGGKSHLVSDMNLFNSANRLSELSGYKNEEEFFTAPSQDNPPPQPPPPPEIIKIQAESEEAKMKVASAERMKGAEMQHGETVAQIQERANISIAQINAKKDKEIANMKIQADAQLAMFEAKENRVTHAMDANSKMSQLTAHRYDSQTGEEIPHENPVMKTLEATQELIKQSLETQTALIESMSMPSKLIRDKSGAIVGAQKVNKLQ
jgi:hypothetical protein